MQKVIVRIEVQDSDGAVDDISQTSLSFERDGDAAEMVGMAVANALKGVVAQWSAGTDWAEFSRYLFRWLEQGEHTQKLGALVEAWWNQHDGPGFDAWMSAHILEPSATKESAQHK